MMRRLPLLVLILVLLTFSVAVAGPLTAAPLAPIQDAAGDIWWGAVPTGAESRPVLVFVHGRRGTAPTWWGSTIYSGVNDMYLYAYNAGYRTAFVQLDGPTGTPSRNMWSNGETLRGQIDRIANHYGVRRVILVGHSKAGVDIDSAVVHYGAAPRVSRVFTLASPHWGTPLADLGYSWWGGWLAAVLGEKDDGLYILQPAYMRYFRSLTDGRPEKANVPYFTGSGTSWGPLFAPLWFAGLYLGGANDGLIPEPSTHIPGGTHLFTRAWHHDNIRLGRTAFPLLQPFFEPAAVPLTVEPAAAPQPAAPALQPALNQILRGGEVDGVARTSLPLEAGVRGAAFALLSSDPATHGVLVAPDGRRLASQGRIDLHGETLFAGASAWGWDVADPEAGLWSIEVSGRGAYLLVVRLESALDVSLHGLPADGDLTGARLSATVVGGQAEVRAVALPAIPGQAQPAAMAAAAPFVRRGADAEAPPALPAAEIVNLAITITGTAADGSPFERNLATSVLTGAGQSPVGPPARLYLPLLRTER